MDIYDFVPAHTVEQGDLIAHQEDYIEVSSVVDSGDAVMVKGFSHVSGDSVFYIIEADKEVGLWSV